MMRPTQLVQRRKKLLQQSLSLSCHLTSISRHTARVFGMPQWQSLRPKLRVWRGNIANAINTIQANKVTEDGGQGMQD
uniref:eIF3 subunit M C-terminal helix domain-containing protein n=1 Tax=Aegilops tauschii subsp. strangulata TaxID=200361 RepID=A0A452XGK2_AEGTS